MPLEASASFCPQCESPLLLKNRYFVTRILGKGGFGKTYELYDPQGKSNADSRKVLKVSINNHPDAIRLFQREATVLQKLQHPGIPKVAEYFKFWPEDSIDPLHCIVMEYIDGRDLQSWLATKGPRPITPERAIAWLKQLVEILSVLHQNPQEQYFHRDIKPANIMIRPNGKLVLIDFGAVREVTNTLLYKVGKGRSLTGINSPGYAPPEQMNCKPLLQSDFFALGRTMVHLLTEKHPLDLEVDPQTGKLIWRQHAPTVTKPLADLIDYLMAPFPGQRPQNTDIIEQCLEAIDRGKNWQESKHKYLVLSMSIVAILSLGFGGWRWGVDRMAADLNRRGVTHHLAGKLYLAQAEFKRSLLLQPDRHQTWYHLGRNYDALGDIKQARHAYNRAIEGKLPAAYSNLARLDILEGQYPKAIAIITAGLKLDPKDSVKYGLIKNLGWAYKGQNRYSEAKKYLQAAINLDGERASAYCLLAQVLEASGSATNATIQWQYCRRYADITHIDEQHWGAIAEERLTNMPLTPP